jgi:hypothetical protein
MQLHGVRAKGKRRLKVTTDSAHDLTIAPNLLGRNFVASAPDRPRYLLLRSPEPLATRDERKHKRPAEAVLSKETDLSAHRASDLQAVAIALNTRPRKTLGWRTPAEAFNGLLLSANQGSVATTS